MKRLISVSFILILFTYILSPLAFATLGDVHNVTSPLSRPEVGAVTTGSQTTYTCAFMSQYEGGGSNEIAAGSYLYIVKFTLPSSVDVVFYPRNYNSWYFWCAGAFYIDVDVYDIETGNLNEHYMRTAQQNLGTTPDSTHTYGVSPRQGYYPSQTVYNSHLLGAYWYLPSEITIKTGSSQGYYADWVTWSVRPLDSHLLKSFTSEPTYDYLNRYIVLGGQNDGYIYHLGYYAPQLAAYTESHGSDASTITNTYITYDYFFAPQLKLTDSGLTLSLHMNTDLYQFWTQINSGGVLTDYEVLVSKYRLSDGQYVSSSLFTGSADSDKILSYSFGNLSDFNSIKLYGVQYIDESSSRHFNLLSCLWSYDLEFSQWRASISSQLENIISILRGDGSQTTLPIDADVANQVSDYVSQEADIMNEMDTAVGQIDNVFGEAESHFSSASSGFSFINMLLEKFVFDIPQLYIIVFFSLTFGIVILIIGRSMN